MDKTSPMLSKPLVNVTCKFGEKSCFEDGRCHALGNCENKIATHGDQIRAMSDEELAVWMAECNAYGERADASQWLPWLKQPAEE